MAANNDGPMSTKKALSSAKGSLLRRTKRRARRAGLDVQGSYTRGEARHVRQFLAGMKEAYPDKVGPTKAQKARRRQQDASGPPSTSFTGGTVVPDTSTPAQRRRKRRGNRSKSPGNRTWGGGIAP